MCDNFPIHAWSRSLFSGFFQADYYKDAAHFRLVGEGSQYRLEIPYAKLDFTGTYSVIARNCHGEAKAVISLQIYAKGKKKKGDGDFAWAKIDLSAFRSRKGGENEEIGDHSRVSILLEIF